MIQLKINNMDHKAILTVPTDYERVTLALWTLGLDRDPEKYTLRQLEAEFTYTTEEESQMVRLIDPRSSLMNALCFLSEMVYRMFYRYFPPKHSAWIYRAVMYLQSSRKIPFLLSYSGFLLIRCV